MEEVLASTVALPLPTSPDFNVCRPATQLLCTAVNRIGQLNDLSQALRPACHPPQTALDA